MHRYAIALGSNRRHGRHGAPGRVIIAAIAALAEAGPHIAALSPIVMTAPMGLAGRRYANAAVLIETALEPHDLLRMLKLIERQFGRRGGQRWSSRVLDLDIVLWSGGRVRTRDLSIPHPGLTHRRFVLDPLVSIAPAWRAGGYTIRQLRARLITRR